MAIVNSATRQSETTNEVIDLIVALVKEHSHKTISRDAAKAVYRGMLDYLMRRTTETGVCKLPWGYGQFYVRVIGLKAKPRRMPDGREIPRTPKAVLRFQEGELVKEMLGTKKPRRARNPKP